MVLVVFSFGQMLFISQAQADSASIFINPKTGTFTVDSTFDVSVLVDTGGQTVNAIEVFVQFPADKLQVVTPATGQSFVSLWLQPPTFSNKDGTLSFVGGVPAGGIRTSAGLVSTITFRVKAPGPATVKIGDKSNLYADDGRGTAIATIKGRSAYTFISTPPEGPKVFSVTHPDQEAWYQNNNVIMGWDTDEQVAGYSYTISQSPSEIPDNTDDTSDSTVNLPGIKDGIWYFHIKQKKNNLYGDATHYALKIDTSAPAEFKPEIDVSTGFRTKPAAVRFITTDALSGIDHYEIGIFDNTRESGEAPIFLEADSPYRIPDVGPGSVKVVIRAFDHAGNTRDGVVEFKSKNFVLALLKENYIGLGIAFTLLILFMFHMLRRHRARVMTAKFANYDGRPRTGNFI
ncbi:MAG: cohesin domain-containing protein [Candidatus Yanofskybacteria bacterium]|nr:cohesin domain-containing protein [Candidatus Yanofskybacteria bacterium]